MRVRVLIYSMHYTLSLAFPRVRGGQVVVPVGRRCPQTQRDSLRGQSNWDAVAAKRLLMMMRQHILHKLQSPQPPMTHIYTHTHDLSLSCSLPSLLSLITTYSYRGDVFKKKKSTEKVFFVEHLSSAKAVSAKVIAHISYVRLLGGS